MILKLSAWSQFLVFFFSVYSQQSENQPITKIWLSLHCLFTELSHLATFDPLLIFQKRATTVVAQKEKCLCCKFFLQKDHCLSFLITFLTRYICRMLSKASLVDICIRKWSYFCLPDFYGLAETHR